MPPAVQSNLQNRLNRACVGSLLGTAIGDAIALPFEGMSKKRVQRFLHDKPLQHRFLFGWGFCSDDTEHACMVAQALLSAGSTGENEDKTAFVARFRHNFAWRLRGWIWGLPAGIGMATLRSIIKLWLWPFAAGNGVHSAGNAPAMRSAIIGVCLGHDIELMRRVVAASTQLTHTDPRAEHGALAIALAAWMASQSTAQSAPAGQVFPDALETLIGSTELTKLVRAAGNSATKGESSQQFAATIGGEKGVSGFVMHTVPVALHAWFRHEHDYPAAIEAVLRCGGDTDTVAAITGGIVGAGVGPEGIPEPWLGHLAEWPRSRRWIKNLGLRLASRFATDTPESPLPLNLPLLFLRNVMFMIVVLLHGFRRLLPPY